MKKAALFLMMSSTAFAAQPIDATTAPQKPPQLARRIVHRKRAPQAPLIVTPQAAKQQPKGHVPRQVRQSPPQLKPQQTPQQALAMNAEPGIKAPKFGDFELKAQLRNMMTMARAQELQNVDGQNFGLGTEVRVGLKHTSGWGFNLTASHQTNNYADSARNTGANGDASLMVIAPSFYKDDFVDFHGIGRFYLPTSDSSRSGHVLSADYRNFLDFNFGHSLTATNLTITRFFDRDNKDAAALSSFVYNSLEFTHQTMKTVALAFGGQFEADNSYGNGTGTQVDLYPFIDFTVIPNVLIETKYYFPVFVGGNRSVGASGVALDQSQAELFVKIAI